MKSDNRPLSPHLQVYKWETSMAMSILHRVSGVGSAMGLPLLTIWLALASSGEQGLRLSNALFNNAFVVLVMFFWSGALFYHLCNGIRHLLWDAGKGLTVEETRKSARYVQIATAVFTLALWITISVLL